MAIVLGVLAVCVARAYGAGFFEKYLLSGLGVSFNSVNDVSCK